MLRNLSRRTLDRIRNSQLWDEFIRDLAEQLGSLLRPMQVTSGFDGSPVPDTIAYVAFVDGSAIGAVYYDAHVRTERWLFTEPNTTSLPKKTITLKPAKIMKSQGPQLPDSETCALLTDGSSPAPIGIIFRGGPKDEVRAGLLEGANPSKVEQAKPPTVLTFKSDGASSVQGSKTIPSQHDGWRLSQTACSDNGLDGIDSHITYMSIDSSGSLHHWRSRQSIQPLLPHKEITLEYVTSSQRPNQEKFWRQTSVRQP